MEETELDNITKKLMADSYTSLSDAVFTDRVMHKVLQIEKRKTIACNIVYFFIIMVTSGGAIFFMLKTLQQKIGGMSNNLTDIGAAAWLTIEKIIDWIQANEFFIMPLVIMLVFKSIVDIIIRRKSFFRHN